MAKEYGFSFLICSMSQRIRRVIDAFAVFVVDDGTDIVADDHAGSRINVLAVDVIVQQ